MLSMLLLLLSSSLLLLSSSSLVLLLLNLEFSGAALVVVVDTSDTSLGTLFLLSMDNSELVFVLGRNARLS